MNKDEQTRAFFLELGIAEGMHVLDLGCGQGATSEIVSNLVGPHGQVTGVDPNSKQLDTARQQAKDKGLENIEYVQTDLSDHSFKESTFDMIVGRRVLMHIPDPEAIIGRLAPILKPGGSMGFQEHEMASANNKLMPLHNKVNHLIWQTVEKSGGNIQIGQDLWRIFSHPMLTIQDIQAETMVQTPNKKIPLAPIAQAQSSVIIARGIASKEELDIETLDARLDEERRTSGSIFIRETIFYVYAKKSSSQ